MPKVIIDNIEIEVEQGTSILEAAKAVGIDIPHFCYHPNLSIGGNCRMCLVEVEKMPKPVISCATPATDGMVVHTQTPKILKARKGVMEFLLLNHPLDCPICDQVGECSLQEYYMLHAQHKSRLAGEKVHKHKVIDLGDIILDSERCVLCGRCVRFSNEVMKTGELAIYKRGTHSEISTFEGAPIRHDYSGNLTDICPVGALTSKDFRFKKRVYKLTSAPSVCNQCSTGCNIYIDSHQNQVYRFRGRRNDDVNQSWICNHGRFSYKQLNKDGRLQTALHKSGNGLKPIPIDQAVKEIAGRLLEIRDNVAVLASADATNETNGMAVNTIREICGSCESDFRLDDHFQDRAEVTDGLLRRADPHANSQGCVDLKLNTQASFADFLAKLESGSIKAAYVLNAGNLESSPYYQKLKAALEKISLVVMHSPEQCDILNQATYVIPGPTFAEQDGTFTNYAGMVQAVRKAIEPPNFIPAEWVVFGKILRAANKEAPGSLEEVRKELGITAV